MDHDRSGMLPVHKLRSAGMEAGAGAFVSHQKSFLEVLRMCTVLYSGIINLEITFLMYISKRGNKACS